MERSGSIARLATKPLVELGDDGPRHTLQSKKLSIRFQYPVSY
ncbi:hypothetical protein Pr1d_35500 [Bythopirellula goksoeyrii]|uniref:Uncharacterized protein n=1 Tax=Bythopirellula goksoeyrii TaxID=1400387 RepID=A0A5B9QBD6_9BACT|nr:hypothetical protein Pr1d_35500 [Bythopirellula goksoeyrii]